MEVESVLHVVGTWGPFQALIVTATQLARMASILGMFFITFGIYEPPWVCADTVNTTATQSVVPDEGTVGGVCDSTHICEHLIFLEDSSTLVTEWGLVCDKKWIPPFIASLQMAGFSVGSLVGGQICELFGRKKCVFGYLFLFMICNLCALLSDSWQTYATIRFFTGFSISSIFAYAFVYAVEFLSPRGRSVLTALPIMNGGTALISILTFFMRDWRNLHIAMAVLAGIPFLSVFWIPESLRWLYAHGRLDQANQVARKIGRFNNKQLPEENLLKGGSVENENKLRSRKYTYRSLFKQRKYAILCIKTCLSRTLVNFVYYTIGFGVSSFPGDFYINFIIFSVAEVPIIIFVIPVIRFFKRRSGVLIFSLTGCISCILIVVLHLTVSEESRGYSTTILALLAQTSMQSLYQVHDVYVAELFPTVLRVLNVGFMVTVANVGGILAPILIPSTPEFMPITFSVLAAMLIVLIGINQTLPETKGLALEDFMTSGKFGAGIYVEDCETLLKREDEEFESQYSSVLSAEPRSSKYGSTGELL